MATTFYLFYKQNTQQKYISIYRLNWNQNNMYTSAHLLPDCGNTNFGKSKHNFAAFFENRNVFGTGIFILPSIRSQCEPQRYVVRLQ